MNISWLLYLPICLHTWQGDEAAIIVCSLCPGEKSHQEKRVWGSTSTWKWGKLPSFNKTYQKYFQQACCLYLSSFHQPNHDPNFWSMHTELSCVSQFLRQWEANFFLRRSMSSLPSRSFTRKLNHKWSIMPCFIQLAKYFLQFKQAWYHRTCLDNEKK